MYILKSLRFDVVIFYTNSSSTVYIKNLWKSYSYKFERTRLMKKNNVLHPSKNETFLNKISTVVFEVMVKLIFIKRGHQRQ